MPSWSQELEDDLKWREAELASLKVLMSNADERTVRHIALLRSTWALLYAHYEGFCKFAWDLYLSELQRLNVPRKDCTENIAILSLEKRFRNLRGNFSSNSIWDLCDWEFHDLMDKPIEFQVHLETESNLWPSLLKKNSQAAGLRCVTVDKNSNRLKALVSRRNDIAHGKKMVIESLEEYQTYYDAALEVMHELALDIVDVLDGRQYLRIP